MNDHDLVNLLCVVPNNVVWFPGVQRRWASERIKEWLKSKNLSKEEGVKTFAAVTPDLDDESEGFYFAGVVLEHIMGMYTQEATSPSVDRLAAAQEELVKIAKRSMNAGEEWRSDNDDDI